MRTERQEMGTGQETLSIEPADIKDACLDQDVKSGTMGFLFFAKAFDKK